MENWPINKPPNQSKAHHYNLFKFDYLLSCFCFESGLRGLLLRLVNLSSLAFGLGPLAPERGLLSVVNSPMRELKERFGLWWLLVSFPGVGVELVILGLLVCLNSPRLLVITSSRISLSPIWEAPAPNSDCCYDRTNHITVTISIYKNWLKSES